MNNYLKKWLSSVQLMPKGKAATSARSFQVSERHSSLPGSQPNHTAPDSQHTIVESSDNGIRRQLVQVLLRDVARRHGLPMQTIDCQMQVVASRSRGPGMVVRLVLRQWDERVLRYAFAIQTALQTEILRFDPKASDWLHGVSWQLDFTDCPYTHMPEKSFWSVPSAIPEAAEPAAETAEKPAVKRFDSAGSAAAVADETPDLTRPAPLDFALQAAAALNNSTVNNPALQTGLQHVGPQAMPSILGDLPQVIVLPGGMNGTSAVSAMSESDAALKDLEQLFFIRDQELTRSSEATARHYEKTQPSPLQQH